MGIELETTKIYEQRRKFLISNKYVAKLINPLNVELNPICHLLALLGAHHFLHVNRIRVNLKILM
jgi:hypothetical protein